MKKADSLTKRYSCRIVHRRQVVLCLPKDSKRHRSTGRTRDFDSRNRGSNPRGADVEVNPVTAHPRPRYFACPTADFRAPLPLLSILF